MANYDKSLVSRQSLISTRRMALDILYEPHRKISLYDRSWFVSHEHLNIRASSFHAACARCWLTFFAQCGIKSLYNEFLFYSFILSTTKCIYWVEKIITIILKNCGLIVKELPGALVRAWSLRQKLPVGTEHAFLLPFLSAVFRSSAVSKVVFMEYEFFSMMRIILFLLLRYSDSSWHCVCGIHKCKHRILQSSQIIACQ